MAAIIHKFTLVVRRCTFTSGKPLLSLSIDIKSPTARTRVSACPRRIKTVSQKKSDGQEADPSLGAGVKHEPVGSPSGRTRASTGGSEAELVAPSGDNELRRLSAGCRANQPA